MTSSRGPRKGRHNRHNSQINSLIHRLVQNMDRLIFLNCSPEMKRPDFRYFLLFKIRTRTKFLLRQSTCHLFNLLINSLFYKSGYNKAQCEIIFNHIKCKVPVFFPFMCQFSGPNVTPDPESRALVHPVDLLSIRSEILCCKQKKTKLYFKWSLFILFMCSILEHG